MQNNEEDITTGTQTEEEDSVDSAIIGGLNGHGQLVSGLYDEEQQGAGGFLSNLITRVITSRKRDSDSEDIGYDRRNISTQTEEQDPVTARGLQLSYLVVQELALERCIPSSARDEVYESLCNSVYEILDKHLVVFNGMINRIQVTNYFMFSTVANELFEANANNEVGDYDLRITWGRIVSLFAFAVRLAREYRDSPDRVDEVIRFLASYVTKHVIPFVRDSGGWASLVEQFPAGDMDSQMRRAILWSGLCSLVCDIFCFPLTLCTLSFKCLIRPSPHPSHQMQLLESTPPQIRLKRENVSDNKAKGDLVHHPVNPVDEFCVSYYTTLSHFSFDKAKELVDKQQREYTVRVHGPHGIVTVPAGIPKTHNWLLLLQSMNHFTVAEKGYMNLTFLAPKGFLRKDSNLKSSLMVIKSDLKKLSEPILDEHAVVREEVIAVVGLRLDLMDFYEKLSLLGTAKNVEIVDLLSDVELIVDRYNEEKRASRSAAKAFYRSLGWEIESVTYLLKAHATVQNWEFLSSLIYIQDANKLLTEWGNYLQLKESSKKSTFYNFPPALPILYVWIWKLKATLLSKFSLYFYEILAKNSNETYNIRLYCSKMQTDLHYKLASFQKKSDALSVCLVFDARDVNFHANGYQHPKRVVSSPQGLESFPAILAIPSKPASHWPSVVMIISDRLQELNVDKFVGIFDSSVQATYFVMRMDAKVYMVAIYESKKSEKDSYTLKFMQEFAVELKCGKIFSSLKCGMK
ncbi:unnamed protein product [Allacma fusca]|uniref:Bcl-2 Bcl-2 homology region 1-3 domain-containing protein n=1 Tax=Allacma fusca TaxID=39272 RepID=A0A8J2KND1_9HEXA|nr:unnamed protein product [Allacma fusca]